MNSLNDDKHPTESTEAASDNFDRNLEVESMAPGFWGRIFTLAGLVVLGITPFAHAQLDPPNYPALCPPLTALANPTLFDLFWGTTPIRFPYQ
ncbi:MAG: hypothetical protein IPK83_16690 [Planctomycetes bacterium]|nr:hypothetical protein [Planctomycetota bacterium]